MEGKIIIDENKYAELVIKEIKYYELDDRIDKALSFIKKQKPWWEEWHYDMCGVDDDIEEIEKILKGEDL